MTTKHLIGGLAVVAMLATGFTAQSETVTIPVDQLTVVNEEGGVIEDQADDQELGAQSEDALRRRHYGGHYRNHRHYRPYRYHGGGYRYYGGYYRYYRPYRYHGGYRYYGGYGYYGWGRSIDPNSTENLPAPQVERESPQ